ncbi:MAG: putative quinol monooxygenase [Eubacteriales bacterium]|jgi:quinol monooxygenase YgiN|nr:putative quinol monooxygenase [Eubacteriales bacterium]
MVLLLVKYTMKPGTRDAFLQKVEAAGITKITRNETGNLRYEFYCPVDDADAILLLEQWTDFSVVETHRTMDHIKLLVALKKDYVIETQIERFDI